MNPILIGCPFDNGIQMMQRFKRGITGAADGPQAVLAHLPHLPQVMLPLAPFNLPTEVNTLADPPFIRRQQAATEAAQAMVAVAVAKHIAAGRFPIAIGGDHSLAFPLVRGAVQAHPGQRLGLIYIDAHLDMRSPESHAGVNGLTSSGNSFRQVIEERLVAGKNVAAIGVHRSSAPVYHYMAEFARAHSVTIIGDNACTPPGPAIDEALRVAQAGTDGIYLSVDIDAVAAEAAPGVSTPAKNGLAPAEVLWMVAEIARRSRVVGFDVVEVSSRRRAWFELFGRPVEESAAERQARLDKTARLAAAVIEAFVGAAG
jgi:arginase family enzyme